MNGPIGETVRQSGLGRGDKFMTPFGQKWPQKLAPKTEPIMGP